MLFTVLFLVLDYRQPDTMLRSINIRKIIVGTILLIMGFFIMSLLLLEFNILRPSQVSLLIDGFLAILTGIYVLLTGFLAIESRAQRSQRVLPRFIMQVYESGVRIENIGTGPGINTNMRLRLKNNSGELVEVFEANDEVIRADEGIFFNEGTFNDFGRKMMNGEFSGYTLECKGSCENMLGKEHIIETIHEELEIPDKGYTYETPDKVVDRLESLGYL